MPQDIFTNSPSLAHGSLLSERYLIQREIGRGGMGIVYHAWDKQMQRAVAIKVLLKGSGDSVKLQRRFHRELQISAQLDHPNILKIYDFGIATQMPYMVSEYIDGKPLPKWLASADLSLDHKLELLKKLAQAVNYAHKRHIVHRDIKPENVMIRSDGEPVLMDFGIARTTEVTDHALTRSGEIIGTPQYMSPEQAHGVRRNIDEQSDIYSLGAVMYYMLVGRPPVEGDTFMSTIYTLITQDPPLPRSLVPDLPENVELICLKAMARDKKKRYRTARELDNDLQRYLQGRQSAAWKAYYRQRWLRAIAAMAFIVLIAFALVKFCDHPKISPGLQYYRQGQQANDPKQAEYYFQQAYEFFKNFTPMHELSKSWQGRALAAMLTAGFASAKKSLEKAPQETLLDCLRLIEVLNRETTSLSLPDKTQWHWRLRLLLANAYFKVRQYDKSYKYAEQLLKSAPKQGERMKLQWLSARCAFFQNSRNAATRLQDLLAQTPGPEITIGCYYFLGRLALEDEDWQQAITLFEAGLRQQESCREQYKYTQSLYLYYCNSLLTFYSGQKQIGSQSRLKAILPKIKPVASTIYREVQARYLLQRIKQSQGNICLQAQKMTDLLDQCIASDPTNAIYYFLRGQSYRYQKKYAAALKNFNRALQLDPRLIEVIAEKIHFSAYHMDIKLLQDYYQFLLPFGRAFAGKPQLFSDEFRNLRRTYQQILLPIPFSPEKLRRFYQQLDSHSAEARHVAANAIRLMHPRQKVLLTLQRLTNRSSSPRGNKLIEQLEDERQVRQRQQVLRQLVQIPETATIDNLQFFNRPEYCSIISEIFYNKQRGYPILLRFLAARLMAHLPRLQLRQKLYRIIERHSQPELYILASYALHEIGLRISSRSPVWSYNGNDEFLAYLLVKCAKQSQKLKFLRRQLDSRYDRIKILAAASLLLLGNQQEDWRQLAMTVAQGLRHSNNDIRILSIISLWHYKNYTAQSGVPFDSMVAGYLPEFKSALAAPSLRVRQAAVRMCFDVLQLDPKVVDHKQLLTWVRHTLQNNNNVVIRCWCIILLVKKGDPQALKDSFLNPQAEFIERVCAFVGLSESPDLLRHVLSFFAISGDEQMQSFSASMMTIAFYDTIYRKRNISKLQRQQLRRFFFDRIKTYLDSNQSSVRFWALLAAFNIIRNRYDADKKLIARVRTIWQSERHWHIKSMALAVMLKYGYCCSPSCQSEIEDWLWQKLRQNDPLRQAYARFAIWCYSDYFNRHTFVGRESGQRFEWDEMRLREFQLYKLKKYVRSIKKTDNRRRFLQQSIGLLTKIHRVLDYLPGKVEMRQRYTYILALFYYISGNKQQALAVAQKYQNKSSQHYQKCMVFWQEMLIRNQRRKDMQQWLPHENRGKIDSELRLAMIVRASLWRKDYQGLENILRQQGLHPGHPLLWVILARTHPYALNALSKYHNKTPDGLKLLLRKARRQVFLTKQCFRN